MKITDYASKTFNKKLESIKACFSNKIISELPSLEDFPKSTYNHLGNANKEALLQFGKSSKNPFALSVAKRIIAIEKLQIARDNNLDFDFEEIWELIADSITEIPDESIISTVGSQGFLSIPLFKHSEPFNEFEFIRLHIWDNSLQQYINQTTFENFSIHSHMFDAQSWIMYGGILNETFKIDLSSSGKIEYSKFKIEYNKDISEVNEHSSEAINTGINVDVQKLSKEEYYKQGTYRVRSGDFHRSVPLDKNGLAATLFSFNANFGFVEKSFVIGPAEMHSSKINRKMYIDPKPLILKLTSLIKKA